MTITPTPPDEDALPIDLKRLALGLAARWRWIAALGAFLGLLLAAVVALRGTDRYEARVGLVKRGAHNEIHLDRNIMIERDEFSMSTVAGSVKTARVLRQVQAETQYPGDLARLSRSIEVENPRQTELLVFRVQDTDPERAAKVARSLLGAFLAEHSERSLTNAREAIRVLSARRETVTARLGAIEERRQALLEDNGFSDVEAERTALLEQRNFVEQELVRGREALTRARRARQTLGQRLGEEPDLVTFSETADLPLQRELARVEVELAGLHQRYTAEHPQVAALREEVQELKRRITEGQDRELRKVTQQLNPLKGQLALRTASAGVEAEVAAARVRSLKGMGQQVRARLELLREVERSLLRLDREAGEGRELLQAYRNGLEGAEILIASDAPIFEVVEEPLVPSQPLPSKKRLYAVVAGVAGVGLAFLLVLVLELRDTRIRAAEELYELGLDTVHVLPAPRAESAASYLLAAQVLAPAAGSAQPPLLAGLTDDPAPDEVALALAGAGVPKPIPARAVAHAPLPQEWQGREPLLVIPAGRVPRETIERYLRRARRLGVAPAAAIFVSSAVDTPFDTLSRSPSRRA
jgi:uncharacterized protein involved in exopolysaccharide biosynthesis